MSKKISIVLLSCWLKIFVANIFCEKIEELRIAGPQYIRVFTHGNYISLAVQKEATAPKKIFKKSHVLKVFFESKMPLIYNSLSVCEYKDYYEVTLNFDNVTLENSTYFFNILSRCEALRKYITSVFKYNVYHPCRENWEFDYISDDVYGIEFPPRNFLPSILDGNRLHLFLKKDDAVSNFSYDEEESESIYQLNEILFKALPKVYSTFKILSFETHYEIVVTLLKL